MEDAEEKIDISKEKWKQEMDKINENIVKKASDAGIFSKEEYFKNY